MVDVIAMRETDTVTAIGIGFMSCEATDGAIDDGDVSRFGGEDAISGSMRR